VAARATRREREHGGAPQHHHKTEQGDVHTHTTLIVAAGRFSDDPAP
jgi:hypothetical protein